MFYCFFREKVLTSLLKSADISKIMTSYLIFLCHLKHFRLVYNHGRFQVSSIKNSNFRGGGRIGNPPGCGRSKKPGLGRVKRKPLKGQKLKGNSGGKMTLDFIVSFESTHQKKTNKKKEVESSFRSQDMEFHCF